MSQCDDSKVRTEEHLLNPEMYLYVFTITCESVLVNTNNPLLIVLGILRRIHKSIGKWYESLVIILGIFPDRLLALALLLST